MTSVFMQDNASAHGDLLSAPNLAEFRDKFLIIEWPALSPDLNPIENLWRWLDGKKREKEGGFHDLEDMRTWFEKFFRENKEEIQETIRCNIASFYRRLVFVSQNDGAKAPY